MSVRASFCGFPYLEYVPDSEDTSSVKKSVVTFDKDFCCISDYIIFLKEKLDRIEFFDYKGDSYVLMRKELKKLIKYYEDILNKFLEE